MKGLFKYKRQQFKGKTLALAAAVLFSVVTLGYFTMGTAAATTQLSAPSLSLNQSNNQVTVSWTSIPNVSRFDIYRSSRSSDAALITTVYNATSYVDTPNPVQGTTYTYYYVAYNADGTVNGTSATSSITIPVPPKVISVGPPNGATNVGLDPTTTGNTIKVVFNQPVVVPVGSITVTTGGTSQVSFTATTSGNSVSVIPSDYYSPGTTYTVTVTTGVYSVFNNNVNRAYLAQNYSWSFTTTASNILSPHEKFSVTTGLCSVCHSSHSGQGSGLLTAKAPENQSSYTMVCEMCHNGTQASPMPYDYDHYGHGKYQYNTVTTYASIGYTYGHPATNYIGCEACHDPHNSTAYTKGNTSSALHYQTTPDSIAYDASNFSLCIQCHTTFANYPTSTGDTLFYNVNATDGNKDLHFLHLYQLGTNPGNAVCYDCHDPHGYSSQTTPETAHMVDFPPSTVTPVVTTTSSTLNYTPTANGGSCTLVCHGVTHLDGVTSPDTFTVNSQYSYSP